MQKGAAVKPNWNIWGTVIHNLPPNWQERLQQMHLTRDYDALEQYIGLDSNPIPPL